jgi:hypothetical protein
LIFTTPFEFQSGEFGELAGVQPVAGKAAANVLRIAGVLAIRGQCVGRSTHPAHLSFAYEMLATVAQAYLAICDDP